MLFAKRRCVEREKQIREILPLLESASFGKIPLKKVLEKLCGILGDGVECIVLGTWKDGKEWMIATIPEDEAMFYRNLAGERPMERVNGKKALQIKLEIREILKGTWIFEVSEHIAEKEVLEYLDIASIIKYFLFSCLLTQECERRANTDCFTSLPSCGYFEQDLRKRIAEQEQGFLIAVRCSGSLPKPYQKNGINFAIIETADICTSIHPDGVYRIGPDIVAVLCSEKKEEVVSFLQELIQMLPENTFCLFPLYELEEEGYIQIQKGIDAADGRKHMLDSEGIFPLRSFYQEG